jgi:8-oxo-dGTP pyrophosphatase MutT (NUDIX family)
VKEISAGGIVYKRENHNVKILMIEDKYHKLTIPKGKQEAGETLEETAIREIEEETGILGNIVQPLSKIYYHYTDQERGHIDKEVTYYLVEATGGDVQVQIEEINQVFWMDVEVAKETQEKKGYDNNQEVFDAAFEILKEKLIP